MKLSILNRREFIESMLFHGAQETRAPGQYYIDPTGVPGSDGLIAAPAAGRGRAEELARLPLAAFPSRLEHHV